MPPPMQPSDVVGIIALLTGCAVALWSLPSCGHATCSEAHKAALATEHAARQRKDHDALHDVKFPTPGCPHCPS